MSDVQILQDTAYTGLQEKVKKYIKWKRIDTILYVLSFALAVVGFLIIVVILVPATPQNASGGNTLYFVLECVLAFLMVCPILLWLKFGERKEIEANLEDDEWVRFYSGSIVIDLEEFTRKRDSKKKEVCRKSALKNAHDLLSIVESWNIGEFLPVKLYVGDFVKNLKKNLRTRIIPALREGNDEDLARVNQIMYHLFAVSRVSLKIEDIQTVNTKISDNFPKERQFKIGFSAKTSDFFRTHKISKHFLVVMALVGLCILLGYGALSFGASIDTALIVSVTLLASLLVVYFTRQSRST